MANIRPRYDYRDKHLPAKKRRIIGWQARVIRVGYEPESRVFTKKREAEGWAADLESEMARGVFVSRREAEATTLKEALDRYEREITPKKRGAQQEKARISVWRKSSLARRSLAGIRGMDLAKWRDARLKLRSPTTVNHDLRLISNLYRVAAREWGMEGLPNPVASIKVPGHGPGRDRRLLEGEEERLFAQLDKAPQWWLKPIVVMAIETAMRQGELLDLKWDNVDVKRCVARLPVTKNGRARDVPLSSRALDVLEQVPRALKGRVFPVYKQTLIKAFKKACRDTEIEGLRFHDLRHEALSRLAERGFDAVALAKVAGHRTLNMVMRYVQLRAEDLAKRMG